MSSKDQANTAPQTDQPTVNDSSASQNDSQQEQVSQQYFAQPQAAPVQYVVMAESLKGVKGWLMFFLVCFAIGGLSYTGMFFSAMTQLSRPENIIALLLTPFLAALSIATVVFITTEKQLGKWLAIATLAAAAVYNVINMIVQFIVGQSDLANVPTLLSTIVVSLILQGLIILYFFSSRRVKETLVK